MNSSRFFGISGLSPRRSFISSLLPLVICLLLSACGGGSAGGGGVTAVTGRAIDAPISNAAISVTLFAPLNQAGAQILGTTTADSQGNFTLNISFPHSNAPVYANAQSGTTLLVSYLGPANTLATLSSLSAQSVPNLAISQVTTAALAILAATNQLSSLTPSAYATLLANSRNDILAAAAGIMAVVDANCPLPSGDPDTFSLGRVMVTGTSAVSTANGLQTLTNVSNSLGSSCSQTTLMNLLQAVSASQYWAPELDLGDVVENIVPVIPAGTYHIQGLIADTGINANNPAASGPAAAPSIFDDTAVTVSLSGAITSSDGNVSGQIYGNYVSLSLVLGGFPDSFSGKAGILPSGFLSGTGSEGFSIRTGGEDGSGNLIKFDAVLVTQKATPNWAGISGTSEDGTGCSASLIGFRMHGLGPLVGGYSYNLCALTSSSSPNLTFSNGSLPGEDDFHTATPATLSSPLSMGPVTSGGTSYPFILTGGPVSLGSGSGGTLDYVMGANEMIYTANSDNASFFMNENPLDRLLENPQNSDH